MKLYTEKELKRIATISYLRGVKNMPSDIEFNIDNATPIELPSDDEVINKAKHCGLAWEFYYKGAKWLIEKIKQQADD